MMCNNYFLNFQFNVTVIPPKIYILPGTNFTAKPFLAETADVTFNYLYLVRFFPVKVLPR